MKRMMAGSLLCALVLATGCAPKRSYDEGYPKAPTSEASFQVEGTGRVEPIVNPTAPTDCSAEAAPELPRGESKQVAAAVYEEAERLYQLGEYEGALEGFQRAYKLYPHPALLFNIAQACRLLGRKADERYYLQRYLCFEDNPKHRAQAESYLNELTP